MSYPPDFSEWSKEEKEKFAEKRMNEMRLKNAKLLRRHEEVENDRIRAEQKNSAVTYAPKTKKEKTVDKVEPVEYAREWDRGKPDKDEWKSPEHQSSFRNYRSGYERKDRERKDSWTNYPRNERNDSWQQHFKGYQPRKDFDRKDTWSGYSRKDSDNYRHDEKTKNYNVKGNWPKQYDDQNNLKDQNRHYKSPIKSRDSGLQSNEPRRKSSHSYSEEKYRKPDYKKSNPRKKYSFKAHSRSSSKSNSDNNVTSVQVSSIKASSLWQNDKMNEDENKQVFLEKWVKSVGSYSKFERFEHSSDGSSGEIDLPNFKISTENKSFISNSVVDSAKICEGNKGVKTKRSPQDSSASSGKEHLRKQRKFDSGFKNNDKKKFVKMLPNDSWNNSATENLNHVNVRQKSSTNKNTHFKNANTWNGDNWGSTKLSHVDDDVWGDADQSDIKWKLSDDEKEDKKSKKENIPNHAISHDSRSSVNVSSNDRKSQKNDINQKISSYDDPDGMWGNCPPPEIDQKWIETEVEVDCCKLKKEKLGSSSSKIEGKMIPNDTDKNTLSELSEKMDTTCKIYDEMEVDRGGVKETRVATDSIVATSDLKPSADILSEKSHKKTLVGSDDGGWCTMSEGEIRSDDESANEGSNKDSGVTK